MRLAAWLLPTSLALFGGAPAAQEPPKQTPAPFRSGVELIQLDVSVLDAGRSPVHGLSAADFTVLEEVQPRPIVAFTSVDLQAIGPAAFDDGPTTRRHFAPEDDVAAFVRVYQGRSVPLSPVDVVWTVRNSQREPVFTTSHTIAPARFARDRSADVQIDLPLTTLSAGTYLLQVDARRDGTTVQRQVRFTVR